MKTMFCWRCQTEMPMLDETEFALVRQSWKQCFDILQAKTEASAFSLQPASPDYAFAAMLDVYQEMTGYRETNANAIWHHCIALYGPPCSRCGKPLRSPDAAFCAACGEKAMD